MILQGRAVSSKSNWTYLKAHHHREIGMAVIDNR